MVQSTEVVSSYRLIWIELVWAPPSKSGFNARIDCISISLRADQSKFLAILGDFS